MCWFSMAKYLMFAFNFVLFAAGAATLGVGIYISTNTDGAVELIGVQISQNGSYVLIAAGSVALVVGFLGCCGASKESTCLLGLYFTIVLVIVILQLAVGIWALVEYDNIGEAFNDALYELDLDDTDDQDTMESIENEFKCCGFNGTKADLCQDWTDAGQNNPLGCNCTKGSEHCVAYGDATCDPADKTTYAYIYNQNCEDAMTEFVESNMSIIAGIGIGIGCVEILGLIFSICMCQALKEERGFA